MSKASTTQSPATAEAEALLNSPAMAMAMLQQATAKSLAQAAHNATLAQQMGNAIMIATTAQGVETILSGDSALQKMLKKIESKLEADLEKALG